jgi:hypothetical protein
MVRLPRGFLEDLSGVIFKHDVLFLETICRELSIPFREAKIKILGVGEESLLEITGDLSDGDTQCQIMCLEMRSMIYRQCPHRQMFGHSACEAHHAYYEGTRKSSNFVKRDALADIPELQWFYDELSQKYVLWHPIRNTLYSKELVLLEGTLWKDPTSETYYKIHISEKNLHLLKKKAAKN